MTDADPAAEMDVGVEEELQSKENTKEKGAEEGDDVSDEERKHKKKKKKKDKDRDKDKERKKSRKEKSDKEDKEEEEGGVDGSAEDHKEGENGRDHHTDKARGDDDDDDLLKDEREKRNLKERDRDRDNRGGGDRGRERSSRDLDRDRRDRSRSRGRDRGMDRGRMRRSHSRDRNRRRSYSRERRRRSYSRDRSRRDRDRDRYRRPRSRSRSRSRERSHRRRRSPSSSRSSSSRSKSPSRSKKSPDKKKEEAAAPAPAPVAAPVAPTAFSNPTGIPTLQEMLQTYPGIGIPEALQKIEEIKKARQMPPPVPMMVLPQPQQIFQPAPPPILPNVLANLAAAQQMANAIPNAAATKTLRELYVGNLPTGITGPQLAEFLGSALMQLKLTTAPGNPIVNTWLSSDAHYAFCEFRTIDECNAALNLNGISVGPSQLRIGRPKNYAGPQAPAVGMGALGMGMGMMGVGGVGATAPLGVAGLGAGIGGLNIGAGAGGLPGTGVGTGSFNPTALGMPAAAAVPVPSSTFLMMTNLPQAVDEMSVKALLQPFGELKSFNLLKDGEGKSKGTAVFEYSERSQAEAALKLSGIDIGGHKLQVQEISATAAQALLQPVASTTPAEEGATVVIRLSNMVDETILSDAEEVNDIKEEVAGECRKFGSVVSLEIPVPTAEGARGAGQGYIFVEFTDTAGATRALKALKGRSFDGKTVEAEYYAKDLYDQKVYDGQTVVEASGGDDQTAAPPKPLVEAGEDEQEEEAGKPAAAEEEAPAAAAPEADLD